MTMTIVSFLGPKQQSAAPSPKLFPFFSLPSNALDHLCLLALQAGGVALMRLLLTLPDTVSSLFPTNGNLSSARRKPCGTNVVQSGAPVVLKQPVPAAEVAAAEVAVPCDTLWLILAIWECASHLLGRHLFRSWWKMFCGMLLCDGRWWRAGCCRV